MSSSRREDEVIAAANTGIAVDVATVHAYESQKAGAQPPFNSPDNVPLDGGLQAWLQVAASFALYFNHL